MQPEDKDIALLWDMRQAAKEVLEFMKDVPFARFTTEKVLRYAVERQIVVMGEAARRVSQSFKDAHSEIPWNAIVGQRNVLAHEYGDILVERIWLVATERIPELIALLDPLIPPAPATDN